MFIKKTLLRFLIIIFLFIFFSNKVKLYAEEFIRYESNPIIKFDEKIAWKIKHVTAPSVIKDQGTYKMWYAAHDGNSWKIALAISNDKINWIDYSNNPVLTPNNDGIENHTHTPAVVKDRSNHYFLYYTSSPDDASTFEIKVSESADGINWEKRANPVIIGEKPWEKNVANPTVYFDGKKYHMWYIGAGINSGWQIGYAQSLDGIVWEKYQNNPLNIPSLGHVGAPEVKFIDGQFHMFYHTGEGSPNEIYHAISTDGINWNCIESGCRVLKTSYSGFDAFRIVDPSFLKENNKWYLFYAGDTYYAEDNEYHWQIGLATLTLEEPKIINIIIPGLMASWNKNAIIYNQNVSIYDWHLFPFVKEYTGIINSLKNLGYQENQDFFVFPYDWRQSIDKTSDNLNSFLQAKIWHQNPDQKVNLVGHSLGGLIARLWAQKFSNEKLNKLITVGSPHQGAASAYKAIEAGEIENKNTLQWLAQKLILQIYKDGIKTDKQIINEKFPVVKDLLPTYDFLINQNNQPIKISDMTIKNDLLLSYSSNFSDIFSHLTTIVGESSDETIKGYKVGKRTLLDQLLDYYPDGHPIDIYYDKGDGTVLSLSAKAGNNIETFNFNHGEIIYKKQAIKKIFDNLNINYSVNQIAEGESTKISPSLIFLIFSPAKMKVLFGGQTYEEEDGIIFIPNAQSGQYQLNIEGLEKGKYSVLIGQIGEQNDIWQRIDGEINLEDPTSQTDQYLIYFNNQSPKLSSISPVNLLQSFDHLISYLTQLNQQLKNKKIEKAIKDIKNAKRNYQNKKYHLLKINLILAQKEIIFSLNPAKKEIFSSMMQAEETLEDIYYQSLKASGLKVNQKLIKTKFKVLKETFEKILRKLAKEKKNKEEKILLVKIIDERIKEIEKLLAEKNYLAAEIKIIGSFQLLLKI